MKPLPNRLRKLLLGFLVAGGLFLAAVTYAYFEFTAQPDLSRIHTPNMLDAQEAERKLRLFDQARANSRQGFIRLLAVELNSLLHQRMNPQFPTVEAPLLSGQSRLNKCLVDFDGDKIRWYCWVEKKWLGKTWSLIWQRQSDLVRTNDQWQFQPVAMRLGRRDIPEQYWPELRRIFARADEQFSEQVAWLTRLPALEFNVNRTEMGRYSELKLYTYPEPAVLHASR